ESGPADHGHIYAAPGTYTVRVLDFNGDTRTAITCPVTIETDRRRVSASPDAPRANQSVAFSAREFPDGPLRWDFGDGSVEAGGPTARHAYRRPGTFQVRVWSEADAPDSAVGMALAVRADDRQVNVAPSPPRAGTELTFTAERFSGGDLRWDFGEQAIRNGGPRMTHAYGAAGNFRLRVWAADEEPEDAFTTTVAVQPDPRQITVSGPGDIFAGAEVVFEARHFAAADLEWDFDDGTVVRGTARQAHRFPRPGNFIIKAKEAAGGGLPLEKRVQVLKDDRRLELKSERIFVGSEFEIEARNFRGATVHWDFGDGTVRNGPRRTKHRYAVRGQFQVRAVDFAGRDGKTIEQSIRVESDERVLSVPGEIIAGEAVPMKVQGASGGELVWKFSDGDRRSGLELRDKSFRSHGPQRISVIDPAGKFPPLEKTVQVLPDTRSLKGSAEFILPGEEVVFSARNFKGPTVRWDFGDGTVKEGGRLQEAHTFAGLGRFRVQAVDFAGASSKVFSAEVVVAEMAPGFEVRSLELTFDNGKYYRVVAKNSVSPGYRLRVKAKGRGVLSGQFLMDRMPIGLFQLVVEENRVAVLRKEQMAALPTIDLGLHELSLKFSNIMIPRRLPVLKYFVSAMGSIQIKEPPIDAKVASGQAVNLSWAIAGRRPRFEIAVSDDPFQFLDENRLQWQAVGEANSYPFDPGERKPGTWIYWQVRLLNESGEVQTTSEIASFKLGE
ncbi:MAG: PKD domain-containing protein, partial [Candidatus Aminicenantes bacterium]|nr:PKD domain-containing protein [Candidatus Aminicenantes bacterium]